MYTAGPAQLLTPVFLAGAASLKSEVLEAGVAVLNYSLSVEELPIKKDIIVPTDGQTHFTLSQTPNVNSSVEIHVNGTESNEDFIIAGADFDFISNEYILDHTDKLTIFYQ